MILRPPVGIVPAGGRATRLGSLPCSKEILPVGFAPGADGRSVRVAADGLLDAMALAGAESACVVLGHGKWDVPAHLAGGARPTPRLAFVVVRDSPSTPASVARAAPWVKGETVLFGFPDILFEPHDAFVGLLDRLEATEADVVLGLFPAARPKQVDMVESADGGRVLRIVIKPDRTSLDRAWILAAWRPAFTVFLADRAGSGQASGREHYVGDVLNDAIEAGLVVESVDFADGRFLDIGTAEDLQSAFGFYRACRPTPM